MADRNNPVSVAIVLATLGALWVVLRAVTVWAAPPSTGPRRVRMFTSFEADIGVGSDGDGSTGHAGGGGDHGGDSGGDGGGDGGH